MNVGHSQNDMQTLFLYIQVMNNMFLLFPTAVLVIMSMQFSEFFLRFLKDIRTPFKKVSQVSELDVCHSQNKRAYQ